MATTVSLFSAIGHASPERAKQAGSPGSQSRSTSAGCSSPASEAAAPTPLPAEPGLAELEYPLPFAIQGRGPSPLFQDLEYPSPVVVKNTFLDGPEDLTSLEGFLQQRDFQSCPPGGLFAPLGLEAPPGLGAAGPAAPGPELPEIEYPAPMFVKSKLLEVPVDAPAQADRPLSLLRSGLGSRLSAVPEQASPAARSPFQSYAWDAAPLTPSSPMDALRALGEATVQQLALDGDDEAAAAAQPPALPPPPASWAPAVQPEAALPPPPLTAADAERPLRVVRIAETLPEPELGSEEAPTEGSLGHPYGTCKPCAFLHTKGCTNGVGCQFCHLCPPGERKRRQRQKQAMATQELRQALALEQAMAARECRKVSIADALA